jgi:predicted GNAT superfamily acetyltransferase
MIEPRPITPADVGWVLALNEAHAVELSPLSPSRLEALLAAAFYAGAIGEAAFLIAVDQDADYDSPNFLWFRERVARFVYVDRVAVAADRRGEGLARRLYEDLFREASGRGHADIVCEVNVEPPNPASDAFHAVLGFREIGRARLAGAGKSVRYLRRALAPGG